jgi:predicted TIM-barrel fold metal-dependent hydrolase
MVAVTAGADIRASLGHPVVDADGHVLEPFPMVAEYVRRLGRDDVVERWLAPSVDDRGPARSTGRRDPMGAWWALPSDARDRATGYLPALLYERLDEIGIDFAILYTSVGLACLSDPDEEVRTVACRALNAYLADLVRGLGDRLTVAAVIPTTTPEQAIAELRHAVHDLGFKAAVFGDLIPRGTDAGNGRRTWYDVLALDSPYDYDPLWHECVELGVALTVHSGADGIGLRTSSSRYMYNHIGKFAAAADAFAKALFFGGVTSRFPRLNVAFLECGVSWGVQLLCDLVDRWRKRGGGNIERLDPDRMNVEEWEALLDEYGGQMFSDPTLRHAMRTQNGMPPVDRDDFRATGVRTAEDIPDHFRRFYFGCEADDATIRWAYDADVIPFGAPLQPMLGSDIGHWDVPDVDRVLVEAHELVRDGTLSAGAFREFACDNVIRLHGQMNAHFFDGTRVEEYARALLGQGARADEGAHRRGTSGGRLGH